MSNKRKLTRTKLPAPTLEQAIEVYEQAAKTDKHLVVPTHLNRRQRRSMRRRVPVISVLAPVLERAHQHDLYCSHYVKE